jgi:methylenetetrahydrofolate reductase (NADPH)
MLFSVDVYLRFARAMAPAIVIPGIMPITTTKQISFVKRMFNASVPAEYAVKLAESDDDPEIGLALCAELCMELMAVGAPGIHFFTMNNAKQVRAIMNKINFARMAI